MVVLWSEKGGGAAVAFFKLTCRLGILTVLGACREPPSPQRFNTAQANFCIPADQREPQCQSRPGDHPIWQIRNRFARNSINCIGHLEVKRREFQRTARACQCRQYCLQTRGRDTTFLDEINAFHHADRRDVNQISGSGRLRECRFRFCRQSGIAVVYQIRL